MLGGKSVQGVQGWRASVCFLFFSTVCYVEPRDVACTAVARVMRRITAYGNPRTSEWVVTG